jgi:HAD superfamily hydrolase (TIGR01484 family)
MKPLVELSPTVRRDIRGVFVDIDNTLTTDGWLTAQAYSALERLRDAGVLAVPITGRPAGWCDHIARMWPVDAVVGENGAFYFRYDHNERKMHRRFVLDKDERAANRQQLDDLCDTILSQVSGAAVSADQAYRESDLAIDYCEDVPLLRPSVVARIVSLFEQAGAIAKVSSIHVNGWFGDYDKLKMTRIMAHECFGIDLDTDKASYVFVGDSPNDAPMFDYFPNAIGVANIKEFIDRLKSEPVYVTQARCGAGFAEVVDILLSGIGK